MNTTMRNEMFIGLSDEERAILDDFLNSALLEERAMDLATVEGFLTAVTIGPELIMPAQWLPWVWDRDEGKINPKFENMDQADQIINLLMRHYNGILGQFIDDAAGFTPLFNFGAAWGVSEWCQGFLLGTSFSKAAWLVLSEAHPELLQPFLLLGTDKGIEQLNMEPDSTGETINAIVPSLAAIYAFWMKRRVIREPDPSFHILPLGSTNTRQPIQRELPKVGRNDVCPCGSGKKYKKCCGANTTTLH